MEGARRALDGYRSYLESVRAALPPELQRLIETICLHDGRLRELNVDLPQQRVILRLDAGNLTMTEGRRVSLRYEGVTELQCLADPRRGLAGPHGFADVGNDEIEVLGPGSYEHRFLFSTGIELRIRFRGFRYE